MVCVMHFRSALDTFAGATVGRGADRAHRGGAIIASVRILAGLWTSGSQHNRIIVEDELPVAHHRDVE